MTLWLVVCTLAGPGWVAASGEVRDRLVPAPREGQRASGLLGERLALGTAELKRRLEHGARIKSEQLGVLVEAGALAGEVSLREALESAAAALIEQSASWRNGSSLRRGLRGLLAYYEASGDRRALDAARRVADWASRSAPAWWDRELGAAPLAGPACLLFRHTAERRRLTQGITGEMDQPETPRLLKALWEGGKPGGWDGVQAEEILATLTGLVELYRLTGEKAYLDGVRRGWEQLVREHRYVTGTVGWRGRLRGDGTLPGEPGAEVGEAGATAEWLRLNWELLRLSGDSRYGDEIERTVFNHLMALQDAKTGAWAASAPLVGRRRYEAAGADKSAPAGLGLAIASRAVWGVLDGGPAVTLYCPGEAVLPVGPVESGRKVRVVLETRFPEQGQARLVVGQGGSGQYPIYLRVPGWCERYGASVGGSRVSGRAGEWLKLERPWREGDEVKIEMEMGTRWIRGEPSYPGHVAPERGPQVLALEVGLNPEVKYLHRAAPEIGGDVRLTEVPGRLANGFGRQAYGTPGITLAVAGRRQVVTRTKLVLIPFAEAREYRVWLPEPGRLVLGPVAVTAFGAEFSSGDGPVADSICDERADTYRTARGNGKEQSWYAVELDRPEWIERIVYRHGKVMRDGGWFDTSEGKPVVQIKRSREGPWETVGRLEGYPETNGAREPVLSEGQAFEVKLAEPILAVGVRVVGRAARAYSSCAELAGYAPVLGTVPVNGAEKASPGTRLVQGK